MNIQAREEVILRVIQQTGLPRDTVSAEVDRQLLADADPYRGETVDEVVGVLAFYTSPGVYDQWREAEAERLGIRPSTLDRLVEEERTRLAACEGDGPKGRERHRAVARRAGMLLHRGVDEITAYELCAAWNTAACKPPLPAQELQRVLDCVAEREQIRRSAA
jgi:hypothetical protein